MELKKLVTQSWLVTLCSWGCGLVGDAILVGDIAKLVMQSCLVALAIVA
jgi:hypothetical protein